MGTMGRTGLRAGCFSGLGHGFAGRVGFTATWITGMIRGLGTMGRFPIGETGRLSTSTGMRRGTGGGMSETQGMGLRGSGWAGTRGSMVGLGRAAAGVGITTDSLHGCVTGPLLMQRACFCVSVADKFARAVSGFLTQVGCHCRARTTCTE